jgi:putative oxidoreductase
MSSPLESRLDSYAPAVISLFRIVMGFLFTVSGTSSLFGWPVDYGDAPPIGSFPMWWAGAIQLIAGLLITVGLFTRIAAFFASGEMAVAYFWQHQPQGLLSIENGGETTAVRRRCHGNARLTTPTPVRWRARGQLASHQWEG